MENTEKFYTKTQVWVKPALISGAVGVVLSIVAAFADHEQFYFSYLTAYTFWAGIMLGGLFFTMIHNISGAVWSVVLRRIMESLMSAAPLIAVLFIPLIFGIHDLYHWSHEEAVAGDALLQKKAGYLNIPFFVIRSAVYLILWILLAMLLYRKSIAQDKAYDAGQVMKIKRISAPGIVVFALTITFAAFDWLMSLDPHWYSTIFGVYIFAGSFLAAQAFIILFGLGYRKKGILQDVITVEHYHDLAKFLFAFTIFWGYMAFSQYFLIWYANIPEETVWYMHRWEGNWKFITMILVFGHFLIPFLGLMPRAAKRNITYLKAMAIWILVMHFVDLYWIVMPTLHAHGFQLSWIDPAAFLAVGGIFVWYVARKYNAGALVPVNDPKLEESIHHVN
jgi:hypothetical protein